MTVAATSLPGPWRAMRLRVRVTNGSRLPDAPDTRDAALPMALVAVHAIVSVRRGEFISMLEPPEWARTAVDECHNVGTFPVLAGVDGGRDVILSSPIILYDHPTIAPESPGDLYDATEIDEILTLRTLALTEEEKRAARNTDPRAAAIIDRVDTMDAMTMDRLHGAIRYLRQVTGESSEEPRADQLRGEFDARAGRDRYAAVVGPGRRCIRVAGDRLRCGERSHATTRQHRTVATRHPPRRRAGHVPRRASRHD